MCLILSLRSFEIFLFVFVLPNMIHHAYIKKCLNHKDIEDLGFRKTQPPLGAFIIILMRSFILGALRLNKIPLFVLNRCNRAHCLAATEDSHTLRALILQNLCSTLIRYPNFIFQRNTNLVISISLRIKLDA